MSTPRVIPNASFTPKSIDYTPASTLNKAASKATSQQETIASLNSLLALVYGRRRIGGLIGLPVISEEYGGGGATQLTFPVFWCHGEVDAIESIAVDQGSLKSPASFTTTNYTGTTTQGIDPTLRAIYGSLFTDTYPSVAYSVISVGEHKNSNFPRVTALIRGMKVRPTVNGTRAYSTNPTLCLADFIESTVYGAGLSVNWGDVATCSALNDAMIGVPAEKSRMMDLSLDQSLLAGEWIDVLKDYAGLWVVPEGAVLRLIPDVDGSPVYAFDASNIRMDSVQLAKRSSFNQSTGVEVRYTDTSGAHWIDRPVFAYLPGVKEGIAPRRISRISKPGITRYSEAVRYAIERLNNSTLGDVSISFIAFDVAVKLLVGDLITVAHQIWGNLAKVFRLTKADPVEPGRWNITALEFDPAKYSTEVQTTPTTPDTALPSPNDPLPVESLAAVEEYFQTVDGYYSSRIRITWARPIYPFIDKYRVEVFKNVLDGVFVAGADTSATSYTTGAVAEGQDYTIRVTLISTTGVLSDPRTTSITVTGRDIPPTDVPSITATVSGNVTRLTWVPATDLDLSAHELRFGTVASGTGNAAWLAATLINRVPMPLTAYETTAIPTGTWRIFVKARDGVRSASFPYGHESANPAYVDVTISSTIPPPGPAIIGDDLAPSGVSLVNMTLRPDGCWITNMGDLWSALFPNAMSTYTNALSTYHTSGTSSLTTTAIDLGAEKIGTFKWVDPAWTDVSGTASAYVETSLDGSAYTSHAGLEWTGTARYVRGKLETLTTGTLLVCAKGRFRVLIDGVAVAIANNVSNGWVFGGGTDGAVNFDGTNTFTAFATKSGNTYTLTRNVWGTDVTVASVVTIVAGSCQIFSTGTLTVNGHLSADGGAATNTNIGGQGAGSTINGIYGAGTNGGTGGNTGAGGVGNSQGINAIGAKGGAGGAGVSAAGGAGGTIVFPVVERGGMGSAYLLTNMLNGATRSLVTWSQMFGGSGGGGGGGQTSVAQGGGGGGGGAPMGIFARFIAGSGSITAKGGDGSNGSFIANGGGGGGGGGGGALLVATTTATWQSIVTASVAGGIGGASTNVAGTNGDPGTLVSVILK